MAWQQMAAGRISDSSVLEVVSAVAAGIFRTYDQLMAEVVSIEDAVKQASQLPVVEEPPPTDAAEMNAELDRVLKKVLDHRQADSASLPKAAATTPATPKNLLCPPLVPLGHWALVSKFRQP